MYEASTPPSGAAGTGGRNDGADDAGDDGEGNTRGISPFGMFVLFCGIMTILLLAVIALLRYRQSRRRARMVENAANNVSAEISTTFFLADIFLAARRPPLARRRLAFKQSQMPCGLNSLSTVVVPADWCYFTCTFPQKMRTDGNLFPMKLGARSRLNFSRALRRYLISSGPGLTIRQFRRQARPTTSVASASMSFSMGRFYVRCPVTTRCTNAASIRGSQ